MRFFLEIAYKGTNYNGWQVQPNGVSVQAKIDEALSTILRDDIHCIGCGRTDTGVHASQFYLHFDTKKDFPENFVHRLNNYLPEDIAVKNLIPVAENAHARFDAVSRTYQYHILDQKDPFKRELAFQNSFYKVDFELMKQACAILIQFDDFPSFCKSNAGSKTTIVKITEVKWEKKKGEWIFTITADRFLRGMVRLVVGAMFRIGEGRMTLAEFEKGIREKTRFSQALSAPAHGLFLTAVKYPYIK